MYAEPQLTSLMPEEVQSGPKLRVLLADDHADMLEETRALLARQFEIVGTVWDGVSLIKAAEQLLPDVIVTDIKMPQMDGVEATREILRRRFCQVVIALSVYRERQIVAMALEAGIRGYVLKQTAGEELERAIHIALKGGTFVSPEIQGEASG